MYIPKQIWFIIKNLGGWALVLLIIIVIALNSLMPMINDASSPIGQWLSGLNLTSWLDGIDPTN